MPNDTETTGLRNLCNFFEPDRSLLRSSMLTWIIGGVILAVGATLITVIWWRVGDQWADDEYKKFGHGGGRPRVDDTNRPTVINTDASNKSDP